MVSAVCPQCSILLVEANSSSFPDLGTAVNRAAAIGANGDLQQLRHEQRVLAARRATTATTTTRHRDHRQHRRQRLRHLVPRRLQPRRRRRRHEPRRGRFGARLRETRLERRRQRLQLVLSRSPRGRPTRAAARRAVADVSAVAESEHRRRRLRQLRLERRRQLVRLRRHERLLADHRLCLRPGGNAGSVDYPAKPAVRDTRLRCSTSSAAATEAASRGKRPAAQRRPISAPQGRATTGRPGSARPTESTLSKLQPLLRSGLRRDDFRRPPESPLLKSTGEAS